MRSVIAVLFLTTVVAAQDPPGVYPRGDHILPTKKELAADRLPWFPSFAEGLKTAHARQQPLFLWVMNGHPLGCT